METQSIKVRGDIKLSEIMNDLDRGILKIPAFQRQYVWEKTRVKDLLDSIYQEFPIGTFFTWNAPNAYRKFFRDIPELKLPKPYQHQNLDFILDGQQRIISLYVVIKGKTIGNRDYSQICFDLESEEFVIRPRPAEHQIPVYKLFDDTEKQFELFDQLKKKHKESFSKCLGIFSTYPLSVVNVVGKDLSEAIKIFERINQGGKKLSLFDLVAASTWSPDFDLRSEYDELRKELEKSGYGTIPPETILFTMGLCIKGHAKNPNLLEIKNTEVKKIWEDIVRSIELSIDYLSKNQGVKVFSFLPYHSMLSLLAYLYYKNNNKALTNDQSKGVHKWFWRAALAERYTSTVQSYLEEDKKQVMDKILRGKAPEVPFSVNLSIEKIKNSRLGVKSALRNSLFCLLALKEPRNFKNNQKVELSYDLCSRFNDSHKHHIFPTAYLKRQGRENFNSLANFCFIPDQLNKEISDKRPGEYFSEFEKANPDLQKTLRTHLIPYGQHIKNDDYEAFIKERAKLIYEEFEKLVGSSNLTKLETSEGEAIDDLEEKLRDLIHMVFSSKIGEPYWEKCVPLDVQKNVESKIDQHNKKFPGEIIDKNDNRSLLSFAEVMDYYKIISANFEQFKKLPPSSQDLQERFRRLKEYRNRIKHKRELTDVVRKEGEAAIEWLGGIIQNYNKA